MWGWWAAFILLSCYLLGTHPPPHFFLCWVLFTHSLYAHVYLYVVSAEYYFLTSYIVSAYIFAQGLVIYLGLQKIKKFWSTPSVLLFLDANSKSRRFGRYLQKPVVSFMPSTATLIFFVIPRPPELIIDFAHGKSLVSNGLSQNKSCIPIRMVMCTHTRTVFKLAIMTMLLPKT